MADDRCDIAVSSARRFWSLAWPSAAMFIFLVGSGLAIASVIASAGESPGLAAAKRALGTRWNAFVSPKAR